MSAITLGTIERKFAELIWAKEPVTTSELVKLAEKEFSWKRTTTHTVIKRLCDKGLFENNRGTVKALISEKEFLSRELKSAESVACHGGSQARADNAEEDHEQCVLIQKHKVVALPDLPECLPMPAVARENIEGID